MFASKKRVPSGRAHSSAQPQKYYLRSYLHTSLHYGQQHESKMVCIVLTTLRNLYIILVSLSFFSDCRSSSCYLLFFSSKYNISLIVHMHCARTHFARTVRSCEKRNSTRHQSSPTITRETRPKNWNTRFSWCKLRRVKANKTPTEAQTIWLQALSIRLRLEVCTVCSKRAHIHTQQPNKINQTLHKLEGKPKNIIATMYSHSSRGY